MLRWKKLGQVFDLNSDQIRPDMAEFAQCPTAFVLNANTIRVFISSRPKPDSNLKYVAHPFYVDLNRHDLRIQTTANEPLISLGNKGTFDEFGIMPSSIVDHKDGLLIYYSGWTRPTSFPYTIAIGVLKSLDGGKTLTRIGEGPVFNISLDDPYFVTGPSVLHLENTWKMWYLSCSKWAMTEGKYEPTYRIALAESHNGLDWRKKHESVIEHAYDDECHDIFTPFFHANKWHAIFAWRRASKSNGNYRIGYAYSDDLESWVRDDSQAGITLSMSGWDSEMICYPNILKVDGRTLMFYCGNEFGKFGFGVAELVDS
jgi:hypothetical protein